MNELRTNRVDEVDVKIPVLKEPVTPSGLIVLLRAQIESMGLPRIRRNDFSMGVRSFEGFLATTTGAIIVDEVLLNSFEDWLVAGNESKRIYFRKLVYHIRSLINALPEGMRDRRLLTNREIRHLDRFSDFAPATRELLEHFIADGRKVKRTRDGMASTSVQLSHHVRQNAIYATTLILRHVGLNDILSFNSKHVDQYLKLCGSDGRDTAIHTLWNARCLFRWLTATGNIPEDPLAGIGQQRNNANTDFVPADQVAKLSDLATLNFANFRDVRDRLITFALCFDYALRIGEVARLRLEDVRVGNFVEVGLRGEIQKGSGKPSITFRNLFPESKLLFEAYLRLRGTFGVKTDSLLVSEDGRPLLVSGCQNAVMRVSRELGIVTDAGKTAAPHRYRHSLGTLNVGELGMRLTPFYLMRRYRHNDIRTTLQVYVTSNPLLDEAQHIAIVNSSLANGNGNGAANGNGNGHSNPDPQTRSMAADIKVPEMEAMAKVQSLGINWRAMREYAIGERAAVERNGKVFYSEAFIKKLCSDWMTKEEAMRLLKLDSRSGFFHRARNAGFHTLVIGRASLVSIHDVMKTLRNGDDK